MLPFHTPLQKRLERPAFLRRSKNLCHFPPTHTMRTAEEKKIEQNSNCALTAERWKYRPDFSGESRGGVSPPRARRTGREARASSGSHCSAAPIQKAPVSEQIGLAAYDVRQPVM